MPENIRALVYLLIIATAAFFFISSFAKTYSFQSELKTVRKAWYVVVPLAFITGNFYLCLFLSFVGIMLSQKLGRNAWLIYIILGFALPSFDKVIPGVFGIDNFGRMSWLSFISLAFLLPRFIHLIIQPGFKLLNFKNDALVLILIIIFILLDILRAETSTHALREAFYNILKLVVPYYVISRDVYKFEQIKSFFFSFISLVFIASLVSIFSSLRSWQLYHPIGKSLGLTSDIVITSYKARAGLLRPESVYGMIQSAMFSFIALFMAYVSFHKITPKLLILFGIFLLAGILSFSRGPWVAFALTSVLFFFAIGKTSKLFMYGSLIFMLLLISPLSGTIISMLPFIGEAETGTVDYRVDLFYSSIPVIMQNPLFGDKHFLLNPGLQHLIQGEGIIDVVNTYLQIGLEYGLIATGIFILIYIRSAWFFFKFARKKTNNIELRMYSAAFLAALTMLYLTIATVSSMGGTSFFFILVLFAMSTAFINILPTENASRAKDLNDSQQ
ncbi:MAG: O-antigen ligase family protein [Methylophaga sp.]|uniref:O-antigen ligase family protein n=1 Tax=Methylophaga sp. TaxID=2024840 RepID=UPI000C0C97E0|nr:O-antigen ligase family protein [Methylophaga sp.]MBL1457689.1 O-antigen ligase family protein [Methylophaga sp.]